MSDDSEWGENSDDVSASTRTGALIRALAQEATERRSAAGAADSDVLLQVEVDGLHCILVRRRAAGTAATPALSPRELEIARLIAHGHGNKSIADRLQISVWTVNTHVRRIFGKYGVTSRAAIARHMVQHELLGSRSSW